MANKNLLPVALLQKTCNALYNAGVHIYTISDKLNLSIAQVREYLGNPSENQKSDVVRDEKLINKILYDGNFDIATEALIDIEKERWDYYITIERNALKIMDSLLKYYAAEPTGQDFDTDRFKAQLASNFIKETQKTRDELAKHYGNRNSDINLTVEFI